MSRAIAEFRGTLATYPARAACVYYLVVILMGTLLLYSPVSLHPARNSETEAISLTEAAFTATSAACVTGLTVRSTGRDFSVFGQLVILLLLQLGGIGIMTVTTFAMLSFGRRESLRQRVLLQGTVGAGPEQDLQGVLVRVLLFVVLAECLGFLLMAGSLLIRQMHSPEPDVTTAGLLYEAFFHTISAFCNAGFCLFDNSLEDFHSDVLVNLVVCSLVLLGSLGFPVVLEVLDRAASPGPRWEKFSLHTKLMLVSTAVAVLLGAIVFLALEWSNTLQGMPVGDRVLVGLFYSASARTAGFNTVPTDQLTASTLLVTMMLMFIGGGPCSTAGGAKLTTITVLGLYVWARFWGSPRLTVWRRTVPRETIERAISAVGVLAVCGFIGLMVLLIQDHTHQPFDQSQTSFQAVLFDVASAIGTTGLSAGYVWTLGEAGQWVIITMMFLGRLGPLSVFVAFSRSERPPRIEHASGEVLVG